MAVTKIRSRQQLEINSDVTFGAAYRITNALDAVAAQDYVTLSQLNAVQTGLDVKASVRAASTAASGNFAISTGGTTTIDGVALTAGQRVLLKNQTSGVENGIYVVSAGAWSRSTDADSAAEVTGGMFTFVEEGAVNADTGWLLTTDAPALGTTALTFTQFSGAGSYTAGAGLTLTGTAFSVNTDAVTIGIIGNNLSVRSNATAGNVLVSSGTVGTVAAWGTLNLASANAVGTSILNVANGGSGRAAATAYALNAGGTTSTSSEQSVAAGVTIGQPLLWQGAAALPTYGAIALGDTTGNIISGVLRVVNGGTGQSTYANGELLIGNAGGLTKGFLTAGTNITIANAAGAITISAAGGLLQASNFVFEETPAGVVNGTNAAFSTSLAPTAGTVRVYVNGVRQKSGNDYTITGSTYTFVSGSIPQNGDVVFHDYMK